MDKYIAIIIEKKG